MNTALCGQAAARTEFSSATSMRHILVPYSILKRVLVMREVFNLKGLYMSDTVAVENRLKDFILEMSKVELHFSKMMDNNDCDFSDDIKHQLVEELKKVFVTHCTIKERKYGRINNPTISMPPVYGKNEKITKIESISKNKVRIYTDGDNPFNVKYRYILVKKESWLIDYKEYYDDYDKKWDLIEL